VSAPTRAQADLEVEALQRMVAARDGLDFVLWAEAGVDQVAQLEAVVRLLARARLMLILAAEATG